jgi:hypothetical protein
LPDTDFSGTWLDKNLGKNALILSIKGDHGLVRLYLTYHITRAETVSFLLRP